jgi:hypothetical protein
MFSPVQRESKSQPFMLMSWQSTLLISMFLRHMEIVILVKLYLHLLLRGSLWLAMQPWE